MKSAGNCGRERTEPGVAAKHDDQPLELNFQRIERRPARRLRPAWPEIGNDGWDTIVNFRVSSEFLRAIQLIPAERQPEGFFEFLLSA